MSSEPTFGRLEPGPGSTPMSEINMTPLIDVMLVLLVIFILTAPLLVQRLPVALPRVAAPTAPAVPAFLEITLNQAGAVWVAGKPQTPDGLAAALQASAQAHPDTEVRLRADARLPYGRVAEVIALAQGAGLRRVAFIADAP